MIKWNTFFPDDTPVIALPHWEEPRLFIPASTVRERWTHSSLYPAFRYSARLFRMGLRTWAATGLMMHAKRVSSQSWALGEFIHDTLPRARSVSVLIGTPGPTQKIIAQIRDENQEVIGYLKYGQKPAARQRLRQEHWLLTNLPSSLAPRPLKFDSWQEGQALVTSPVEGETLPGKLPPPYDLTPFCYHPIRTHTVAIDKHPWIRNRLPSSGADHLLEPLNEKKWPIVVQHGDLAPWNLRRQNDDTLRAFDWEYGVLHGFPHLDIAHYILQVASLIYDWAPDRTRDYASTYLHDHPFTDLTHTQAASIVRLAAYDAYRNYEEDGHSPDRSLQQWRHEIWN